MESNNRKLVDWILHMVLLSSNGCIYYAKHQVDKPLLEASMMKRTFKLCLTKQLLNMFKLWCEWGISLLSEMNPKAKAESWKTGDPVLVMTVKSCVSCACTDCPI